MNSESVIKELITEVVVKAVVKKLVTAVPFFGLPIVNPIVSFFVMKVAKILYDEMSLSLSYTMIDSKVNQQTKDYDMAVLNLKYAIDIPVTSYDGGEVEKQTEIEFRKTEFRNKLSSLISFNS